MRPEELVVLLTPGARVRFMWPTGADPLSDPRELWRDMTGTVVALDGSTIQVLADGEDLYSRYTPYTHVPQIYWILDVLPRDDSPEELEAWLARPTARVEWALRGRDSVPDSP